MGTKFGVTLCNYTLFFRNCFGLSTATSLKTLPNWITLLVNMSIIMLVECWSIFHFVHRSGQIRRHCSPTNSIRHKLSAVYVVVAAESKCMLM